MQKCLLPLFYVIIFTVIGSLKDPIINGDMFGMQVIVKQ